MRICLFIFSIFFTFFGYSQVVEDFSDGNFTHNPIWFGDGAKFVVENNTLKSNSNVPSDIFYLSTVNKLGKGDLEWRFKVNMKFSTSGANYTDVYLMSNGANLTTVSDGYFLRIGDTKDEISLYKVVSGTKTKITDGTDNKTHNKTINIRITKSAFGSWDVQADYNGGTNYEHEGSVVDNDITSSSYFGFAIKQSTSSFHLKHFFDDIYVGPIIKDTQKPFVLSSDFRDKNTILIVTNEITNPIKSDFSLNNGYGPPNQVSINQNTITLTYLSEFATDSYELTVESLTDLEGNTLDTILTLDFVNSRLPTQSEIVFSEIFPDPTPSIGLPSEEYIELYNTTTDHINLENCTFSDGGTVGEFTSIVIPPKEYLIITKKGNGPLFEPFGPTVELNSFPALNNAGDNLKLSSPTGTLLDSINYDDSFYGSDIAKQGGYSLEKISFSGQCVGAKNWRASEASIGGSPGIENSVHMNFEDSEAPNVISVSISGPNQLTVILSENSLDALSESLSNYRIIELNEEPISISLDIQNNSIFLTFETEFVANTLRTLAITRLEDCVGNFVSDVLVKIIKTDIANDDDIIINELLFNPKDDGVDFIEIYNKSDKYIDLSTLILARYNKNQRQDYRRAGSEGSIIYPKQYLALSKDTISTREQYKCGNLAQVNSLPAMSNDEGIILLLNADSLVLESVSYDEDQHFDLLSSFDGVSLERISPEKAGNLKSNWHSASSAANFATPGYQNSQYRQLSSQHSSVELESKTFSPDGDAYEDVLVLNYKTEKSGTVLNGYVYDLAGRLQHQPFNNELIGSDGFLTWDGITNDGVKLPIGNYILLIETFSLDGQVTRTKLAFSLFGTF
ncbi:MAG: lamin tail domain-containing protein [Bacteroidia bacterium]